MSRAPLCPFLKKACIEHDCALYMHITMQSHPQTGGSVDQFGCALAWTPLMIVENGRQTRGVQAAVESMRNEVTDRQNTLNQLIVNASRRPAQIKDIDEPPRSLPGEETNAG